jgi:hypothetical protein
VPAVVTCSDLPPVHGGTGAGAPLPADHDPVPLPAEQGADVTARPAGGAAPGVRDVYGLRRGVVGQDADGGGPGDHRRVGAALQGGAQAALAARHCTQRERESGRSILTSARTIPG